MNSEARTPSPQRSIPLGGRAVAAYERDGDQRALNAAFMESQDFATTNSSKHNSSREDTFKTPSSMHKRFDTPGRNDKRWGLGDSRSLQDICEQGFSKSMQKIQGLILEEVKSELAQPLSDLHRRISENKESEGRMGVALAEMVALVHQLQHDFRVSAVDMSPVRQELQEFRTSEAANLAAYREEMRNMESRLSQDLSQVLSEVQAIRGSELKQVQTVVVSEIRMEIHAAFGKAHPMEALAEQCDSQLTQLLSMQKSLKSDYEKNHEVLQIMHEESVQQYAGLEPTLEAQLYKHISSKGWSDGIAGVISQVKTTQDVLNQDTKIVMAELTKIQQALHLDFAEVLEDMRTVENVDPEGGRGKLLDHFADIPLGTHGHAAAPVGLREPALAITDVKEVGEEDDVFDASAMQAEMKEAKGVQIGKKRFREYWAQTQAPPKSDQASQTDPWLMKDQKKKVTRRRDMPGGHTEEKGRHKAMFADAEEMKKKMRAQLIKPQYNVADLYHQTGCAQAIATNWIFDNITLSVIFLNAIWIAVDTDYNDADVLLDADLIFQLAENAFCAFFTFELSVRFIAFNGKRHCLRDAWFIFDFFLVALMIFETWMIPVIMLMTGSTGSSGIGNAGVLRMVRLVRMARVTRMARLLKAIPELVILIKGIRSAARSVSVFFLLWLIIIYIFAIVFVQLTSEDDIGKRYFDSVPAAMNTLFLDGILPDSAELVNNLRVAEWILYPIIMFFIMLAAVTVMYMLVGVLVDVVGVIAAAEKEGMMVANIALELRQAFSDVGRNCDMPITRYEFQNLLSEPQVAIIIARADVDVIALSDTAEVIFEDPEFDARGLEFEKFIEIVLNTRGSNMATVKDVKDQCRLMKRSFASHIESLLKDVKEQFRAVLDVMYEINANQEDEDPWDLIRVSGGAGTKGMGATSSISTSSFASSAFMPRKSMMGAAHSTNFSEAIGTFTAGLPHTSEHGMPSNAWE